MDQSLVQYFSPFEILFNNVFYFLLGTHVEEESLFYIISGKINHGHFNETMPFEMFLDIQLSPEWHSWELNVLLKSQI